MPGLVVGLLLAAAGALLIAGGLLALRGSGAHFALGRRLAGAPELPVGALLEAADLPTRAVRVAGRVRCADPIVGERDDRLVALHRDVEVRLPRGGWRTIERVRETRAFELWDHDGSVAVDPAAAAEPLVAIPHVWHGDPGELGEPFRGGVERLAAEHGRPAEARATTRMLSVVDRLLVLAVPRRDGAGAVRLDPPPGGYVISSLELDDAMRLLGGRRRGLLGIGVAAVAGGLLLVAAGLVTALAASLRG